MATAERTESSARDTFERDGFVLFRNVLDQDLIQEASDHVDWLLAKHPELRGEQLHHNLMEHDAFWVRLISDPRLLDIAEQFIGPNIALFASHYISKPPFTGQQVLWHQDGGYWPLEPMEVVTLWLAVDRADQENGCMRVIPGTHKLQLIDMQDASDKGAVLDRETPAEYVEEDKAVDIVLDPGEVEVHHPNIIHGSHANTSPRRRCGLTIRYIPATTKVLSDTPWPSLFHLRGEKVPGVNDYRPRPKYVEGESFPFRGCEDWK